MSRLAAGYDAVNLVADPLHGYIKITKSRGSSSPAEQDLLDHPWVQRLRRIHQLQSAWWVFPAAEHSRFQHALGAMHLAGEFGRHLYANLSQVAAGTPSLPLVEETLRVAGLLHDVGHGPFGHFFDEHYLAQFGIDHEDISRFIVEEPLAALVRELRASPTGPFELGEAIDPRWVAYLMAAPDLKGFQAPAWIQPLKRILNGLYTADNMDYVPRDAYMCGVAIGPVDIPRLMHYTFLDEQGMLLHQHGAEALLMFLNSRLYLYNNLYYHRTVRRIDLHMREIFRATIEEILPGNPLAHPEDYLRLTDWSLINIVDGWARQEGPSQSLGREWGRIVRRELKWRMVFEDYMEIAENTGGARLGDGPTLLARIREELPRDLRSIRVEVDMADTDPRPFNPVTERAGVRIFNPITDAVEESVAIDLLRRLPLHTSLVRVFTDDDRHAPAVREAAKRALQAGRGVSA